MNSAPPARLARPSAPVPTKGRMVPRRRAMLLSLRTHDCSHLSGSRPCREPEGPLGRSQLPAAQEALEQGAVLLPQAAGRAQLRHSPGLHHQHAVRVQDGVEPAERPGHALGKRRRNPPRCLLCRRTQALCLSDFYFRANLCAGKQFPL